MAFDVRLSAEESDRLRDQAAPEHRSMHEVAVPAIRAQTVTHRRATVLDELFDTAASEDAELLERLAR